MESKTQPIEDKMAIKQVVDVFSNLADTKEIKKQVLLFLKTAWWNHIPMANKLLR